MGSLERNEYYHANNTAVGKKKRLHTRVVKDMTLFRVKHRRPNWNERLFLQGVVLLLLFFSSCLNEGKLAAQFLLTKKSKAD